MGLLAGCGKTLLAHLKFNGPHMEHHRKTSLQDAQKGDLLTRPTPARQDAPCHKQGRSEVRDAKNNERHACGRRRGGEPAVSRAEAVPSYPSAPRLPGQALFPWYVESLNDAKTPSADVC